MSPGAVATGALIFGPDGMAGAFPVAMRAPPTSHCVRRLPHDLTILSALRARGVALDAAPDETAEGFEARMETALMALFRDTGGGAEFEALYEYAQANLLPWVSAQSLVRSSRRLATRDPLELSQDTWVNIFRYASSFRDDEPASFRVWSRAIARNLHRRRGTAHVSTALQELPEGLHEPADFRSDPASISALREDARTLSYAWTVVLLQYLAAWHQLSPRDRLALDLVEVQGCSYHDAAAHLGVGLSNMKMIMFRARKRLCVWLSNALARPQVERRAAI